MLSTTAGATGWDVSPSTPARSDAAAAQHQLRVRRWHTARRPGREPAPRRVGRAPRAILPAGPATRVPVGITQPGTHGARWRTRTNARNGSVGGSPDVTESDSRVTDACSRSARRPRWMTLARTSTRRTYWRSPSATPTPPRWPTVYEAAPACTPAALPSASTTVPGVGDQPARRCSVPAMSPPGTKHSSWLSGLAAVTSPSSLAMARTSGLERSPTGNRAWASCAALRPYRK